MTSDALSRLRAGLDRDEALARAAAERSAEWRSDGKGVAGGPFIPADPEWGMAECGEYVIVYDEGYPTEPESIHIAEFDPARVLRQVAAIREVVARYEDALARERDRQEELRADGLMTNGMDGDSWAAEVQIGTYEMIIESLASIYPAPTETGDPS